MQENITLIEYHNNFIDNMTSIALGKMIEEQTGQKCYFENNTQAREEFEKKMSCLNANYSFISTSRAKEIAKKAHNVNRFFINKKAKNHLIKTNFFNINDTQFISKKVINELSFKDTSFIFNYDILEEITNSNSIGLYISSCDIIENNVNYDFIFEATKRLNKYIKKPKLFIFTNLKSDFKINSYIEYKIIQLDDYKEEFELLKSCKHKIILNTKNSYSQGLWASVLGEKENSLIAFDKNLKMKKKKRNWIAI